MPRSNSKNNLTPGRKPVAHHTIGHKRAGVASASRHGQWIHADTTGDYGEVRLRGR